MYQETSSQESEKKSSPRLQRERQDSFFLWKCFFNIFTYTHTHSKTMQEWPASLKAEKEEALAQSSMFTLLSLNKTELSITALKVSFYSGISNVKPTALLFKIC